MTELAVCLPVIILLVFASLEGANMLFVRQAVVQAAYEMVKAAVKTDGNLASATALGTEVLTARGLTAQSITIDPPAVNGLAAGTPVRVTIQVNGNSKTILGYGPFRDLTIEAQATMFKE